jgi:Protein of unknown function (DUF3455)
MLFRSATRRAFMAASRSIRNKRIFPIVLIGAMLLAVIATSMVAILCKDLTVHTSNPLANIGSLLNSQNHQDQDFRYPDPSDQSNLPDSVKVTGHDETVLLRASVREGDQIYECQASTTDPSGYAWKFQAPFALLNADNGTNVIHSTDPTWLYTEDGSEVKGKIGQYTNPDGTVVPSTATPDANSIPWLRLNVTEYRGNSGLFSKVDQIQRLYTGGGQAPKDGCNRDAANEHVIRSVKYTAEYVFWGF